MFLTTAPIFIELKEPHSVYEGPNFLYRSPILIPNEGP